MCFNCIDVYIERECINAGVLRQESSLANCVLWHNEINVIFFFFVRMALCDVSLKLHFNVLTARFLRTFLRLFHSGLLSGVIFKCLNYLTFSLIISPLKKKNSKINK